MLVLVCWFICARIEPAIGRLLRELLSNFELHPKTERYQIFQALSNSIRSARSAPVSEDFVFGAVDHARREGVLPRTYRGCYARRPSPHPAVH
jgi:hypothetical protein